MICFAEIVTRNAKSRIAIYRARDDSGQEYFAYIRCDEKGFLRMRRDFEMRTPCDSPDIYGEVLYRGDGTDPDEAAKAFLKNRLEKIDE